MEKLLYFFVHYGVLALLITYAGRRRPASLLALWAGTALLLAVSAFLFLWGQWAMVGTHYLRWLPALLFVFALIDSICRQRRQTLPWATGFPAACVAIAGLALSGWISLGVAKAVEGRQHEPPFAELEFPLRDGRYYIALGGSHIVINNHLRTRPSSQDFAIDINKLGPLGGASANPFGSDNNLHHIFGEPVYAPCSGTVTEAASHVADNAGASMDVNPADGTGNYAYIDCGDFVVALVHMQANSVRVSAGDRVETGDLIGRVGNSGFSQEPHLHFQAARRLADGSLAAMPMRFNGRTLVRNDIIVR